ncbi:MAG TPA: PsbP-related protein [Candidatus Nitrosopolaris sp.]|nr:PsbP-related protein [Candidatus Nitrosopolaris sp.]
MKTKLILSTLVLIVVISYAYPSVTTKQTAFAQQATTTTNLNFLPYENSTYGIKLQYPSGWDKEQNGTRQNTETDVVTFSPPAINSNASLDVTIDDISAEKGTSLAQYSSGSIIDLKQSKGFKLVGLTTNNVLAGLPSYKLIYTYLGENTIFKAMEIGAIKGDKVYILTYEAGIKEYNDYLPIIQKMIDSIGITK